MIPYRQLFLQRIDAIILSQNCQENQLRIGSGNNSIGIAICGAFFFKRGNMSSQNNEKGQLRISSRQDTGRLFRVPLNIYFIISRDQIFRNCCLFVF
jgi:hypothetical protein